MKLRRLLVLLIATALLGTALAPSASAATASGGEAVATTAKAKKCKKKKKKGAKKAKKCKKKKPGAGPGGGGGLPGAPLEPDPPVDPVVTDIVLTPSTVLGGDTVSAEVTIEQPAETGGLDVVLSSDMPSRVAVPAGVHVDAGQTSADFQLSTTAGPTVTVPVSASLGVSTVATDLTVVEEPSLVELNLARRCYPSVGLTTFGANRVSLDVPAVQETTIDLESSDPTALGVPDSVIVDPGQRFAVFGVDTLMASPEVTVSATYDGDTAVDSAAVLDGTTASNVESLSVSPAIIQPTAGSTGTVTLACEAGPGGAIVSLSSGSPEVGVPASVVVPEDSFSATFPITTTSAADGDVTISATLGGTQQAVLRIEVFGT